VAGLLLVTAPGRLSPFHEENVMKATTDAGARQPRPKPFRTFELTEAPALDGRPGTLLITVGKQSTFYGLSEIPDAAWGRGFALRKEDGTEYAVNTGDPARGITPSCDCMGFERWGRKGPCKHLQTVKALAEAGQL
jgi:hypothetical protein